MNVKHTKERSSKVGGHADITKGSDKNGLFVFMNEIEIEPAKLLLKKNQGAPRIEELKADIENDEIRLQQKIQEIADLKKSINEALRNIRKLSKLLDKAEKI